jgi:hypothetical protein
VALALSSAQEASAKSASVPVGAAVTWSRRVGWFVLTIIR